MVYFVRGRGAVQFDINGNFTGFTTNGRIYPCRGFLPAPKRCPTGGNCVADTRAPRCTTGTCVYFTYAPWSSCWI